MRAGLPTVALLAVLHAPALAQTETARHERVVLVGVPDVVVAATAAALGPWSIDVQVAVAPAPVDDAAAHRLALANDATAIAWIEGAELVLYDDLRGATERRPIEGEIDDVAAAAIALTIKTALRKPLEIAAVPEPEPEPEPEPIVIELPRTITALPPRVRVAGHAGVGVGVASPTRALIRASARVAVTIRGELRAVGSVGGSGTTTRRALEGHYLDATAGAGLEWARALGGLTCTPFALATVHWGRLSGVLPAGRMVSDTASYGGLEVGLAVDHRVGATDLGAVISAEVVAPPTRYQVQGEDVLHLPPLSVGVALRIAY